MIGTNKLEVNRSTMNEIVQHYFDTVLFTEGNSPIVKAVHENTSDYTFRITAEETSDE